MEIEARATRLKVRNQHGCMTFGRSSEENPQDGCPFVEAGGNLLMTRQSLRGRAWKKSRPRE